MKRRLKQFPIYLSEEKYNDLKKEAEQRDLTVNGLIKSKLFPEVKKNER